VLIVSVVDTETDKRNGGAKDPNDVLLRGTAAPRWQRARAPRRIDTLARTP